MNTTIENEFDDSFLDEFDLDQVEAMYSDSKRRKVDSSFTEEALKKTLQRVYGYSSFRTQQLKILQALLTGQDAAVFWSTGAGKSMLYQLPPLHLNKVAVVVSPLVSLMQDQVHKLNALSADPIAVCIHADQNPSETEQALQGNYNIIYVTPERLPSLVTRLAQLPLCLVAIDEAHCVSEWGWDFRPSYRDLGKYKGALNVPWLAVTATAVPRVQDDIVQSLQLKQPMKDVQSFDRTNLKISVRPKSLAALKKTVEASHSSTLVYAATRSQVEEIAACLKVAYYHAGCSSSHRQQVHIDFLTGKTPVIVCTVAFGMGVDKPDVRSVIHYGPPKTVEEYYQQIGRAGRDGLSSECVLFCSPSDFDKFKSDYYVGGLKGPALEATLASMNFLRSWSLDSSCRRRRLVEYFGQAPPFDRCGMCDNCALVIAGIERERNMGPLGARLVLAAIHSLNEPSLTTMADLISGKPLDHYKYKGSDAGKVKGHITRLKQELPRDFPLAYYREVATLLAQTGYLLETTKKVKVNGYDRAWTVYSVTPRGHAAMLSESATILIPVPRVLREMEQNEEEKRLRILAVLEKNGVKVEDLPEQEVELGDGETVRAYSKWYQYLEGLQRAGKEERLLQVTQLLQLIEKWRSEVAVKYSVAPASVLAEHIKVAVAYATATLPPGLKMNSESVAAAGVRSKELSSLITALADWVDKVQSSSSSSLSPQLQVTDPRMVLGPKHSTGSHVWKHALYRPMKKLGMPVWEASYVRLINGENPQTIAMSPPGGRPIQVSTVVGHVLDAVVHGKNIDLNTIASFMAPPTKSEWERLEHAEAAAGMNVVGDPECSGVNGGKFSMTDLLRPIIGNETANKPFADRSEAEKQIFSYWCYRLKWYIALRRANYQPTFA